MKMPALLSRNTETLPGVSGIARVDKNTAKLVRRVGPGDIVILDAVDLDRVTADASSKRGSPLSSTPRRRFPVDTRTSARKSSSPTTSS